MPQDGSIRGITLVHAKGDINCRNPPIQPTNWGCTTSGGDRIGMYITTDTDQVRYPIDTDTANFGAFSFNGRFYTITGQTSNDPVLKLQGPHYTVSAGEQWRVWYGEALFNMAEEDNSGETCYYVDLDYKVPTTGGDVHYGIMRKNILYTFNGAGDYIYSKTNFITTHVRSVKIPDTATSVLAAIALKDETTKNVVEIWWAGDSSENIIVNHRHADAKKNSMTSGVRFVEKNKVELMYKIFGFTIVQNESMKTFDVLHEEYEHFRLTGRYGGRASFSLSIPPKWNTFGLGGTTVGSASLLCDRNDVERCLSTKSTGKQIHEIARTWHVSKEEEIIFEKAMPVKESELVFQKLKIGESGDVHKAKRICGDHQLCLFDFLATKSAEFANFTLHDFGKSFDFMGDEIILFH